MVDGVVGRGQFAANPMFSPDGKRFFSSPLSNGVEMKAHACLDCGLVWWSTPPEKLEEFVRKNTNQKPAE